MSNENDIGKEKQLPKETELSNSLHVYLPGILGTTRGMKATYQEMKRVILELDPEATFIGKNSFISLDAFNLPNKKRHHTLAQQVLAALDQNRQVYLYGHSLGVAELARVVSFIDYSENLDRLHLILMSPVGFGKNLKQMAEMLKRLRSMVFVHSERLNPTFGLETLAYLPLLKASGSNNKPTFVSSSDMAALVTRNFYQHSQLGDFGRSREAETIPAVLFSPASPSLVERFLGLSTQQQQRLKIIDTTIGFLDERKKPQEVQEAFARRGTLLAKNVEATFNGLSLSGTAIDQDEDTEPIEKTTWLLYAQAFLGSLQLLSEVVRGIPYKELASLQQAGVDISFLVPEFDTLVRLSEIVDFLGDDAIEKKAVQLRTATHNSAGLRPEIIAEAVRHLLG